MRDAPDNFRAAILAELGHAPEVIEPGRIQRFSTSGRASDKAGWCQLFEDGRAGVFGDFRSGMSSLWTAQRRELMTPADRADMARRLAQAKAQRDAHQRQQQAGNAQRNAALWAKTVPVSDGDPVSLYLRRRGLAGPVSECLRLYPHLTYWDGGDRGAWPAMLPTPSPPPVTSSRVPDRRLESSPRSSETNATVVVSSATKRSPGASCSRSSAPATEPSGTATTIR